MNTSPLAGMGSSDLAESGTLIPWKETAAQQPGRGFALPVRSASVRFLNLFLQDAAVDLELASSVIALDPGLAYGTLELANRELPDDSERIWRLPQAIVTAGRDSLQQLVAEAPRLDCWTEAAVGIRLCRLVGDGVARACVAEFLARELGIGDSRKCFLSGLLFELPRLVRWAVPARMHSPELMLVEMCHTLPASVVRAVLAAGAEEGSSGEPAVALVLLADAVLRGRRQPAKSVLEEVSDTTLWQPWSAMPRLQRSALLQRSLVVASWASKNLQRMHPWEFMARLEHRKSWE